MKGITPVIAIILLLLITIAMVGLAFMFFQRTTEATSAAGEGELKQQTESAASRFVIESAGGDAVYIRNNGKDKIKAGSLGVYVDGKKMDYTASDIAPDTVGSLKISEFSCGSSVKVTGSAFSDSVPLNYKFCADFNECVDNDNGACEGFTPNNNGAKAENKEYSFDTVGHSFTNAQTNSIFSAPLTMEFDAMPKAEGTAATRMLINTNFLDSSNKGCAFYHYKDSVSDHWKLMVNNQQPTVEQPGSVVLGNKYHVKLTIETDKCMADVENTNTGEKKHLEANGAIGAISADLLLMAYGKSAHTHYDNVRIY